MASTIKSMLKPILVGISLASVVCSTVSAAPVLWVDDTQGNLGTVDVATGAVNVIGNTGQVLTDIAFDPSGNLYGINFGQLFSINKTTAATTLIGNLGTTLNSLVFGSDGSLYAANNQLYKINVVTGAATLVGSGGSAYASSGDLAFAGGNLYLTSAPSDNLVQLSPLTGAGTLIGAIGFSSVFGLASDNNVNLFGLSGTQVLQINPATGAGTSLLNYSGKGLGQANGSAFVSEAGAEVPPRGTAVPEPATAVLLGLGLFGFAATRRKRSV